MRFPLRDPGHRRLRDALPVTLKHILEDETNTFVCLEVDVMDHPTRVFPVPEMTAAPLPSRTLMVYVHGCTEQQNHMFPDLARNVGRLANGCRKLLLHLGPEREPVAIFPRGIDGLLYRVGLPACSVPL